jgi:PTH2 family peptidyl-tRNA hydrolase
MCAQSSHASMSFLTKGGRVDYDYQHVYRDDYFYQDLESKHVDEIDHWLKNSFRKICVYVNSEQELDELHQKALDNGLISHMIIDNGATEFNGVKTKTAIAIGPHESSKFDGLTDHLPLL